MATERLNLRENIISSEAIRTIKPMCLWFYFVYNCPCLVLFRPSQYLLACFYFATLNIVRLLYLWVLLYFVYNYPCFVLFRPFYLDPRIICLLVFILPLSILSGYCTCEFCFTSHTIILALFDLDSQNLLACFYFATLNIVLAVVYIYTDWQKKRYRLSLPTVLTET